MFSRRRGLTTAPATRGSGLSGARPGLLCLRKHGQRNDSTENDEDEEGSGEGGFRALAAPLIPLLVEAAVTFLDEELFPIFHAGCVVGGIRS